MTTDGPSTLTPEIKALVGREWVFTAPEEMGRASIRKFALATGEVNRLYYDEAYALKSRYGGTIAPPTLVCETWQYMDGELDELGSPSGRPTLHLGTEIRGGHEYTFHQPLRPEDILTARWKISDIRERGRQDRHADFPGDGDHLREPAGRNVGGPRGYHHIPGLRPRGYRRAVSLDSQDKGASASRT